MKTYTIHIYFLYLHVKAFLCHSTTQVGISNNKKIAIYTIDKQRKVVVISKTPTS